MGGVRLRQQLVLSGAGGKAKRQVSHAGMAIALNGNFPSTPAAAVLLLGLIVEKSSAH